MALQVQRIRRDHRRNDFDCGKEPLNTFLWTKARQNDNKGNARTYVLVDDGDPKGIIGYFTLCTGAIEFASVPELLAVQLPSHRVPTILLARLAVGTQHQGQGYGSYLLIEAFKKAIATQESVGVSLFEVDALDEEASAYYQSKGFVPAVSDPMKLFLPMSTIQKAVAASH